MSGGRRPFWEDPDLFRRYAFTLGRHLGMIAPSAVMFTDPDVRADCDSAREDGRDDGDGAGGDRDRCRDLVPPGVRPTPLGARFAGTWCSTGHIGCLDARHDGCRLGCRV
jgi:hypothetical protein